jgi:hypothetical protein
MAPAAKIYRLRDSLQMGRIATGRVLAAVIELKTFRDRAEPQLIGHYMSLQRATAAATAADGRIPARRLAVLGDPSPAWGAIDQIGGMQVDRQMF